MKNTKKMLPLVVLVIVMAVLVVLLAVLQRGDDTTDATLPLCNFAVEDIDRPPTRATTRCDAGQKQLRRLDAELTQHCHWTRRKPPAL